MADYRVISSHMYVPRSWLVGQSTHTSSRIRRSRSIRSKGRARERAERETTHLHGDKESRRSKNNPYPWDRWSVHVKEQQQTIKQETREREREKRLSSLRDSFRKWAHPSCPSHSHPVLLSAVAGLHGVFSFLSSLRNDDDDHHRCFASQFFLLLLFLSYFPSQFSAGLIDLADPRLLFFFLVNCCSILWYNPPNGSSSSEEDLEHHKHL